MKLRRVTQKAIRLAGGHTQLARQIGGISPNAIHQWNGIPVRHVAKVSEITGIPRHELRPDVYPVELEHIPTHDAQEHLTE